MAAFDTTRPVAALSAGRVSRFISDAFGAFATWNDMRLTRKALYQLSARELDDIGLIQGDIDTIAARGRR